MIIKYNNNILHKVGDNQLFLIDPCFIMGSNQSWTFSFRIKDDHPYFSTLEMLKYKLTISDDAGNMIYKGRIIEMQHDFNNIYKVYTEDKLASLNDTLFRPYEYQGSVGGLFSAFLTNHNSQVSNDQKILAGNVSTDLDNNDYIYRYWENHTSTWALMEGRLLKEVGGYFKLRYTNNGDYLDYLSPTDLNTASTQHVEFGVNLMDLSRFFDASETYTACIPLGAEIVNIEYGQVSYTAENPPSWQDNTFYKFVGGAYVPLSGQEEFNTIVSGGGDLYTVTLTENTGVRVDITSIDDAQRSPAKVSGTDYLLANQQMIDAYGIIYAPINLTTWDDVTIPLNLYNKAKSWLDNQGTLLSSEIDITFADLSKMGINTGSIKVYDRVIVKSEPHNIDSSGAPYLVEKITYYIDRPESSFITIGDESLTLTANISDQKKSSDETVKTIEKIEVDVGNKADTSYVQEKIRLSESSIMTYADSIEARVRTAEETLNGNDDVVGLVENVSNLKQTSENMTLEFSEVNRKINAQGETIDKVNAVFDFSVEGLEIGREGSTSTMLLDNDSLEFKVNQQTVAEFTNDHAWARNFETDNQIGFFDQWAIRKGANVSGVGENLNDIWIGG